METSVTQKAYAKVNLDLYITGKKTDGYHLIKSVMQTIDLHDVVTVTKSRCTEVAANREGVPLGEDNTVVRVVKLMNKLYNTGDYHIDIEKNIPIAAGLGGPSADAAAAIRAIDYMENLNLDDNEKASLGLEIGADVPFLLRGGLAHCMGIGEIVEFSSKVLPGYILLAKPKFSISTPWAYGEFDKISEPSVIGTDNIIPAIESGNYNKIFTSLYNDLEKPVIKAYPIIGLIKDSMIKYGAKASLMSGSGSAVFGIFEDECTRDNCKDKMKESFSNLELISAKPNGMIGENS